MLTGSLVGGRPFNHRLHITYSWLAAVDGGLFFAGWYLASWFIHTPAGYSDQTAAHPYGAAIFAAMTLLAMFSMGLYQPRLREEAMGIALRTLGALMLMTLGMATISHLFPALHIGQSLFAYAAAMAFVSSLLSRQLFTTTLRQEQFNRRVLVLGAGRRANHIADKMRRKSDHHGFRICGYVAVPGEEIALETGYIVNLDRSLFDYVQQQNIHQLVVALDHQQLTIPAEELLHCRMAGVPVLSILDFFEQEAGKVLVEEASPEWFIFAHGCRRQFAGGIGKRAFDIAAGLALLLVSWPVMLLALLVIKLEDGLSAPVIFRQPRVGLHGRVFHVMKFRSMAMDAEVDGQARWATANDPRITRVGRVIRKLRIDELPQIFNVLAGTMALVGPRPERPEFVYQLAREIPYFDKRHCAKPGITGWAQLNYPYGNSVTDARRKLEFDLYYVKNQSLYLDCRVLLRTVEVVVFGKGGQ